MKQKNFNSKESYIDDNLSQFNINDYIENNPTISRDYLELQLTKYNSIINGETKNIKNTVSGQPFLTKYINSNNSDDVMEKIESFLNITKFFLKYLSSGGTEDIINSYLKKMRPKRGPGRPRKTPRNDSQPIYGIKDHPKCDSNICEFDYFPVLPLRNIIEYLSNNGDTVELSFLKDKFIMYNKGTLSNSTEVVVEFNCKNIYRYYCQKPCSVGTLLSNCLPITKKLNANCEYISIYLDKDSYREDMFLQTKWHGCSAINETRIILSNGDRYDKYEDRKIIKEEPQLEFTLQKQIFKNIVNDAVQHQALDVRITYTRGGCLNISYDKLESKCNTTNKMVNEDEFKIKDNLKNNIYSINISTAHIKNISNKISSDFNRFICYQNYVVVKCNNVKNSYDISITIASDAKK